LLLYDCQHQTNIHAKGRKDPLVFVTESIQKKDVPAFDLIPLVVQK
jgi:hypothetical protein